MAVKKILNVDGSNKVVVVVVGTGGGVVVVTILVCAAREVRIPNLQHS